MASRSKTLTLLAGSQETGRSATHRAPFGSILNHCLGCVGIAALGALLVTSSAWGQSRPPSDPRRGERAYDQPAGPRLPNTPQRTPSTANPQANTAEQPAAGDGRADRTQPPPGFPVSADAQARLDKLLAHWEQRTSGVKTFRCVFERYEYDPVFGPRDAAKTRSQGEVRFAAPDKGLFKEERVLHYTPPEKPGEQPKYTARAGDVGEYWVCDGQSIYEYRAPTKTVAEIKLPPEMQGEAIGDGPLPFLFGAKAEDLKRRYWIRELPPLPSMKDTYRLEAYPRAGDAADFLRAEIILDREEFLPVAMQLDKTRHADGTLSCSRFVFKERRVNDAADQLGNFVRLFVRPSVPLGWKTVVEDYRQPEQPAAGPPRQADSSAPPAPGRR